MTTICMENTTAAVSGPVASARRAAFGGTISKLARTILEIVATWQERVTQRHHLMAMDDRLLRDIGLTRADAASEFEKPFWRP